MSSPYVFNRFHRYQLPRPNGLSDNFIFCNFRDILKPRQQNRDKSFTLSIVQKNVQNTSPDDWAISLRSTVVVDVED